MRQEVRGRPIRAKGTMQQALEGISCGRRMERESFIPLSEDVVQEKSGDAHCKVGERTTNLGNEIRK